MRSFIAAVALTAVSTSAFTADLTTREGFIKFYNEAVDIGAAKGATSHRTCDDAKCDNTMVYRDRKYWTTLHRFQFFSGDETVVLCFMPTSDASNSNCADSNGARWSEHFDGVKWATSATYRSSWTDASAD